MTGLVVTILLILYFIPTAVAFERHHHNKTAIIALNVFLGWTFLGWVAALVWSLTDSHEVTAPRRFRRY